MKHADHFFRVFGVDPSSSKEIQSFSERVGIPVSRLREYNNANRLPTGSDLEILKELTGVSLEQLMLQMGRFDHRLIEMMRKNADEIFRLIEPAVVSDDELPDMPKLAFETEFGELFHGDCIELMKNLESEQFDVIFADPPFNLKKLYPSGIDDNLKESRYLEWTEQWLYECIRLLKPGGSMFVWNLPKWNTYVAAYLEQYLTFRHWVAVDVKYSLPIPKRLYPSHYSLLYYCKGDKPKTFHPDRLPMQVCPKCKGDLRDYGGYKNRMNPRGVNLSDVWFDVPPVRHAKYKKRKGANELPIKLLDRVIEASTDEGDVIFDPFGGSGTTYVVAELKKRNWVGVEIGPVCDIVNRLKDLSPEREYLEKIREGYNALFTEETRLERELRGLWTCESVREESSENNGRQGCLELQK